MTVEPRKCRTCKQDKILDRFNYLAHEKELSDGSTGHYFSTECRECYNAEQRKTNPKTGGWTGIKQPTKHTGPMPETIEHVFFCELLVTPLSVELRAARHAAV